MLPFVALVACDSVAVVLVEAADAVDLAIVLLFEFIRLLLLVSELSVVCRRAGDAPGERLDILTSGSGGSEEFCHAITSAIEVVVGGDGFR